MALETMQWIIYWLLLLSSTTPDELVLLRDNRNPTFRCGAVVLNERMIATAYHCLYRKSEYSIITSQGKLIGAREIEADPLQDTAILLLDTPLVLKNYAQVALPRPLGGAQAWGMCEAHLPGQAYELVWVGFMYWEGKMFDIWRSTREICSGDSAGVIFQEEVIVGLIQAKLFQTYVISSSLGGE